MAACIFKPAINLAESVDQFRQGGAPQIFKIIRRFDGKTFPRNSEEIFARHQVRSQPHCDFCKDRKDTYLPNYVFLQVKHLVEFGLAFHNFFKQIQTRPELLVETDIYVYRLFRTSSQRCRESSKRLLIFK